MIPQPFKHQTKTTEFLRNNPYVFCTSDPGTGKTRSVLDSIDLKEGRTLVIAPKSILNPSWGEDIKRFTPHLSYSIASAPDRDAAFNLDTDIVLINHDGVSWVRNNTQYLDKFHTLIIDESTAYKHATSQRSKACLAISKFFERRVLLTGTPNPNGVLDLWHQIVRLYVRRILI